MTEKPLVFALAVLTFLSMQMTHSRAARCSPEPSLEEKQLGTLPPEHDQKSKIRDPDGNVVETGGATICFSPDGRRVAYIGTEDSRSFAVIDGVKGEIFHFADSLCFSPDSKRVAFRAGNRVEDNVEKWWVLVNGEKLREFDLAGAPRFSPDSKRVAYWGNVGSRIGPGGEYTGGKWFIVIDREPSAEWADADYFVAPAWSPDNKTLAALVMNAQGQHLVSWGSKTSRVFDLCDHPIFSPDGKRVAWGAMESDRWAVYVDGKKISPPGPHAGVPVFSPDGSKISWKILESGKETATVGGKPVGSSYDHVRPPVFNPKGTEIAFAANRGGGEGGAVPPPPDGEGPPPMLMRPWFDNVTGGEWFLVVNGKEMGPFELAKDPVYSADGKRVAFRAKTAGKWIAVCGKTRSEPFDFVGPPSFSADGKKIAFGARKGDAILWKVLDLD